MQRTNPLYDPDAGANDTIRRPLPSGAPLSGRVPAGARATFDPAPPFGDPLQDLGHGPTSYPGAAAYGGSPAFGGGALGSSSLYAQPAFGSSSFAQPASGPLSDLAAVVAPEMGARARSDVLSPSARRSDAFVDNAFDAAALNPLVSAASPLLWLAARLNESAAPADVRVFRECIVEEIRRFEAAAMAKGVPNRFVLVARYALCATLDDIILNTAWAGQAQWATRSLVSLLYGETWGGERFFELLQQLVHAPDENIDVLEMLAICLAIGFVGKYRVMEDGNNLLSRLRAELYRIIRRVRGSYERDLAPAWKGAAIPYRAPPSALRFWVPILCALVLLTGFYVALRLSLANRVDIAMQRITALVPATPVVIPKPAIPKPAIPKPATPLTQVQRISAILQREIADRRVEVVGTPTVVAVRLPTASFPSASAALPASEAPLIERIAAALNREPGPILVSGYTDNVPVPPTSLIRSNLELSKARATSVGTMLKPYLANPGRVSIAGRGEDDPIGSNATPEGRARNRRVEMQIPAEETLAGRGAPLATAPAIAAGTAPAVDPDANPRQP